MLVSAAESGLRWAHNGTSCVGQCCFNDRADPKQFMIMAGRRREHETYGRFAGKMARDRQSTAIQKIDDAGIAKHSGVCLKIRSII